MTRDVPPTIGSLVTVTLQPALDVSTTVDVVTPERKLRCGPTVREPGGGGINVARVADRLGAEVRAVVVAGGATGRHLVELASDEGLRTTPIMTEGETRQSFSVVERTSGSQYRFVLPGVPIDPSTIAEVAEAIKAEPALGCLVFSGSMPPELAEGALASLIDETSGADVIVDTSGPALREALQTRATIIKPSARELSAVVGRELDTEREVLTAAEDVLAESTVGALLVSIGPGGAFLLRRAEKPLRFRPPTVQVRSAVGAGDSMVGGLAAALCRGDDLVTATAVGVAAGTAAVITPGTGLCRADDVQRLLELVAYE